MIGRGLVVLAILAGGASAQDDPAAGNSSAQELADKMLASSVAVFGVVKDGGRTMQATQGAGFFLDAQTIVTSAAVCCTKVKGQTPQVRVVLGTQSAFAKVLWSSADDGLALLKLDQPFSGDVEITGVGVVPSKLAHAGQAVFAVQFPGPGEATSPEVATGELKDLAPVEGFDAPVFHTSAPINASNSGGALFDACGNAVGVNWKSGDGTQYAFTLDALLEQLDGVGLGDSVVDTPCMETLGAETAPWWLRLPLGSQWIAIIVMLVMLGGVGLWIGKRSSRS
jgi:S1-C subfamily serine protease